MPDTTIGIQEDLDTIGELLDELGQLTPSELRNVLNLCLEAHVHRELCDPRFKLIVYIHSRMPWGPVTISMNTRHLKFSLPCKDLSQREWREIPWPPALHHLFYP